MQERRPKPNNSKALPPNNASGCGWRTRTGRGGASRCHTPERQPVYHGEIRYSSRASSSRVTLPFMRFEIGQPFFASSAALRKVG